MTGPVRHSYLAMCHTNLTPDLEAVNTFIHSDNYPSQRNVLRSEWGSIGSVRFCVSSIGSITQSASNLGADIYNIFVAGLEAYACIEQDRYSAQFIYIPPYIAGGPLALNAAIGYKFAEVPRILNDQWIFSLRATLSA